MDDLHHHERQGKNRPNTLGKVLKPTKDTDQCNKAGTQSSRTSAEIIDEIAIKHKTALEILANR